MKSNQLVRFAIIGSGIFSETHLFQAFKRTKNAKLLAITKKNLDAAQTQATKYGIPLAYVTDPLSEVLANPDIDAVYIATPNHRHKDDTIAALKAGKHVLLEKPMAMNAKECEEMIAVSHATGKRLMIAHNLRFNTTVNYLKSMMDSGKLGNIVHLTADFYSDGRKSVRSWKYDKKIAGGGAAFDLGVHLIDTLRYLVGRKISRIESLAKYESELGKPSPDAPLSLAWQVDSVVSYLLEFEGNILGRATATFEGPRLTYLEVLGTKACVRAYDWNNTDSDVRVEVYNGKDIQLKMIHNEDNYALEIDAFAQGILTNSPVPVPGEDGLINQRYIDLVNK
jgi:predicted dehydrogenase